MVSRNRNPAPSRTTTRRARDGDFFRHPLGRHCDGCSQIAAEVFPVVDHDGNSRVGHQIVVFEPATFSHQDERVQIIGDGIRHQAGVGLAVVVGGQGCVFLGHKEVSQKRFNNGR